ncbi:ATP-dependent RecD-like DNA helicase [Candidatus Finniella inopinata]|uniref:ATP-dependent RecD2 DNA helicase n=1 Tax=Candidatus Finniella inopinata TaxID=1696036 RepID=A0A4Q7DKK3_9PROT|nr:ATP-dependent RecD-like DNA helicase [Candidatus Finniella inopinata]RZI45206.1 ATP-dependent RecD-like DNA helicase [Candidatus Finniella inopinata]
MVTSAPILHVETIAGLVERVTFHNAETGFGVLKVQVKGKKDLVTLIGHTPAIATGEFVQASGSWIHDRQHGLQFKAQSLTVTAPTTLEGMQKYLGSGMIRGIGPVYAKKLLAAFKENVFQVIEETPERLLRVPGIGRSKMEQIVKSWSDQRIIRDIMVFLHSHGISTNRSVRIYKTYGAKAIQVLSENPYQLAKDIRGIGFVSADQIAANLGIEKTSLIRARAGLSYALTTAMEQGHCGLPKDKLMTLSEKLLEIPQDIIDQALKLELTQGDIVEELVEGEQCIFLKGLFLAEKNITSRLLKLQKGQLPWPAINPVLAIQWVEQKANISLSDTQKQAVEKAIASKLLVITGGPGVGKTTLINAILKILATKKTRIALTAPTGRAAKRLSEATGLEARTLHRLLETNPTQGGFKRDEDYPLDYDLVVVDEVSMVDVPLMNALVKALRPSCALFLVGDADQLPSVGPGQVLVDLIRSETLPVIHLTEIFRQAQNSRIITTAHAINQGRMPDLAVQSLDSDFYFIEAEEPEGALDKMLKLVTQRIPKRFKLNPLSDIQVLCPMTRGLVGTRNMNVELQKILNPPSQASINRFGWSYSVGDKVMQIQNNYDKEVYNGDIGFIQSINMDDAQLTISFDNRPIDYEFDELDEIILAYATTIHKSQGSEYPAVVIPLMMQHFTMLQKNLVYTGITRGKKLVILVGQKKALGMAVKNKSHLKRTSTLFTRLTA